MTLKLVGKVAVVTGGSTGIGFAAAKLMIDEGALVYITGRRRAELEEAARKLGANATIVVGDIAVTADRAALVTRITEDGRRVDILFANAGTAAITPLGSIAEDDFDQVVGVNLKGTVFTIQDLLPLLGKGASIVVTGSTASAKGYPDLSIYGATKAALRSFVRSSAALLSGQDIRINMVSPGTTDTPFVAPLGREVLDAFAKQAPMQRIADPVEIARAVLFLATSDSSYITGVELFVDGGTTQV